MADLSSVLKLLEEFKVLQMFAGAVVLLVMVIVTLRATNENTRTKHIDPNGDKVAQDRTVITTLHMLQNTLSQVLAHTQSTDTAIRVMKERLEDHMDELRNTMGKSK